MPPELPQPQWPGLKPTMTLRPTDETVLRELLADLATATYDGDEDRAIAATEAVVAYVMRGER